MTRLQPRLVAIVSSSASTPEHLLLGMRHWLHKRARGQAKQPTFDSLTSKKGKGNAAPYIRSSAAPPGHFVPHNPRIDSGTCLESHKRHAHSFPHSHPGRFREAGIPINQQALCEPRAPRRISKNRWRQLPATLRIDGRHHSFGAAVSALCIAHEEHWRERQQGAPMTH